MSGIRQAVIAVGVDGSAESLVAAHWAAREARRRHLSLLLINAYTDPHLGYIPGYVPPAGLLDAVREASGAVLDNAAADIRHAFPNLSVNAESVHRDPRRALVDASTTATLTVVGSRGRGRISEVILGSVALYVASHAHSPLAVVPPTADISAAAPDGPILLGVDGSNDSDAAVAFAFDEAAVRGTKLLAALVWDDVTNYGSARWAAEMGPLEDEEEHAVLGEQLAGFADKYPDVTARQVVMTGRPAERLLSYAQGLPPGLQPALIVVGSRGRGGVAGLLLGSTSQQLIAAALIPVIVVRHGNNG
jgi:nucleotide-binding universal stress UspA family protein